MLERFAKTISVIFHPLLMPTIGALLMFNTGTYLSFFPEDAKMIIYLVVLTGTFILPMILLPFLMYKRYVKRITMDNRRERILPLIITVSAYAFSYYIIQQLPLPLIFNKFILAATLSVAATLVITVYWKISAHMIGVGGLVGCILALALKFSVDFRLVIMGLVFISGLVGFSRLYLKAHSALQIYAGFIIGTSITVFVMKFL